MAGAAPGELAATSAGSSASPAGAARGESGAASAGRSAAVAAEPSVPLAGAAPRGLGAAPEGWSASSPAGADPGVPGVTPAGRSTSVAAQQPRAVGERPTAVPEKPASGPERPGTAAARSASGAAPRGGGWRLYGQVDQVLDGHSADLLLVAAHAGGFARSRVLLFLVAGDAPGLVRTRLTALDATRPQGRVQLRDVEAELLGAEDGVDVLGALARVGDTAAAVLACEAVGAADRALETTVEYVKQREQFGRPIGSFQAVKHRLADVYVQLQAARSAAYFAAWAAAGEEQQVGGLALAQALEALRTAAAEGIQLHGGIGFTWEHQAQLYFKRATGDDLLFGPTHRLRAHAADTARLFSRTEVSV
ncbi:acyl-CoA dehydrogenase family protein [Streptomyces sviceus]|uniref:acyl-CoA dehydrogenase family protein n=1 Tax=Streptomyces sviceus TaxID=285530 RepID=UPI0036819A1D